MPQFDAAAVVHRLNRAGRTMLALPERQTLQGLTWFKNWMDAARLHLPDMGAAVPDEGERALASEAFGWLPLIPTDRLRRIVAARCLISPVVERHLFSWRTLGKLLGADHKTIRCWHGQGIDLIVAALRERVAA